MSNWTSITADDLKALGHGAIIDRAATTAIGATDPIAEVIAGAVSRVRRAVSRGNAVDIDTTKVPNSLKDVTVRLVLFSLMERIRFPLSEDQRKTREMDNSDLLRIADQKITVEIPDNSAGTGEMQTGGGVVAVNVPRRQTGRERQSGL